MFVCVDRNGWRNREGGNLEDVESIGEGEERGDGEEELKRSAILGGNGVGESVKVICDSSVCFPHAHGHHCCFYGLQLLSGSLSLSLYIYIYTHTYLLVSSLLFAF